jgi:hypothetical protein
MTGAATRDDDELWFAVGERRGRLDEATRILARVAARWDGRLAAIKRLAEEAHRGGGEP